MTDFDDEESILDDDLKVMTLILAGENIYCENISYNANLIAHNLARFVVSLSDVVTLLSNLPT